MNDIFIEQIVKKQRTARDNIIFITVIALVILIPVALCVLAINKLIIAYFIYIAFFVLCFGVWIIWLVRTNQNVEFEYQMVQDTLVVSRVVAKRKRKEMLKVDVKQFDILDKGDNPELSKKKFAKVIEACGNLKDEDEIYYAVFNHTAYGKTALLFNPNEKVLNSMKPYLNKDIVLKIFYNRG